MNTEQKKIGAFKLIDHGIERSIYFQDYGVTSMDFENIATGIGDDPADAIDDCLEQVAQAGFKTEGMEARIMAQKGWEKIPIVPYIDCLEDDVHYHVSIRWNEDK